MEVRPFAAELKGDPFEEVYRAFVSAYERQGKLATAAGGKDWLTP